MVKGLAGCKNKGEILFLPEKLKKQHQSQKKNDTNDTNGSDSEGDGKPSIHKDPFPASDQNEWKGEKCPFVWKVQSFHLQGSQEG